MVRCRAYGSGHCRYIVFDEARLILQRPVFASFLDAMPKKPLELTHSGVLLDDFDSPPLRLDELERLVNLVEWHGSDPVTEAPNLDWHELDALLHPLSRLSSTDREEVIRRHLHLCMAHAFFHGVPGTGSDTG